MIADKTMPADGRGHAHGFKGRQHSDDASNAARMRVVVRRSILRRGHRPMIGVVVLVTAEHVDIRGVKRLRRVRNVLRAIVLHMSGVLVRSCKRPVDADPARVEQRKNERNRSE